MISMINNKCLRKVTNGKGCFVSEEALEKVLYLRVKVGKNNKIKLGNNIK